MVKDQAVNDLGSLCQNSMLLEYKTDVHYSCVLDIPSKVLIIRAEIQKRKELKSSFKASLEYDSSTLEAETEELSWAWGVSVDFM